jgi:hypothetical protein
MQNSKKNVELLLWPDLGLNTKNRKWDKIDPFGGQSIVFVGIVIISIKNLKTLSQKDKD